MVRKDDSVSRFRLSSLWREREEGLRIESKLAGLPGRKVVYQAAEAVCESNPTACMLLNRIHADFKTFLSAKDIQTLVYYKVDDEAIEFEFGVLVLRLRSRDAVPTIHVGP